MNNNQLIQFAISSLQRDGYTVLLWFANNREAKEFVSKYGFKGCVFASSESDLKGYGKMVVILGPGMNYSFDLSQDCRLFVYDGSRINSFS